MTRSELLLLSRILFIVAFVVTVFWVLDLLPHSVSWPIHLVLRVAGLLLIARGVFRGTRLLLRSFTGGAEREQSQT